MPIRRYKPTTPSLRQRATVYSKELSKKRPEKKLTVPLRSKHGRSRGRISVRGRGGGHKRMYRIIDFARHSRVGLLAEVIALEYDPNRSAHIALLQYDNGDRTYILAPDGLKVGDKLSAGSDARVQVGNAMPLESMPIGAMVHNVELQPGQGARIVRAAGQSARVMAKEDGFVQLRLSSGEVRMFASGCFATVGQVGNIEHARRVLGKAGISRKLGRRPTVRGTAMSAGDHPHGGGEGRTGTGRIPRTVYGRPAYGVRTRQKNKMSNKYIVKTRRQK